MPYNKVLNRAIQNAENKTVITKSISTIASQNVLIIIFLYNIILIRKIFYDRHQSS